nr:hypothetical protein [Myxococcales bacterium]
MLRYALLSFVVVGPACTGGRGIDGPQNLQEALEGLGVDTTESDRVGADGEILPEDYAPLGSAMSFGDADEVSGEGGANKTDELVLLGTALAFGPDRVNVVEANGVQIGGDFTPDYGSIDVLHSIADDGNAWIDDRGLRAATAGDLDADGLDEIVIAYVDTTVAPRRLHVRVIEDGVAGFTTTDTIVGDGEGVEQLQVATGDFDGDGRHSIVVGVSLDGSAELWFLDPQEGQPTVDDAKTLVFDARNTGAQM